MVYRGLYSYRQPVCIITLFPNISFRIVSACWASLQKFLQGKSDAYKQLLCIMQCMHFQVRVGVFNCQQILAEISFVIFDIVVKKQIECGLVWHWWNSTDLGLINWHIFNQSECRNCCLYIIIQKITPQAKSGKYFQIWFFSRFWGKNGGVLGMRMQIILDSLFARPGSAPLEGRKKGESRDWTRLTYVWVGKFS